MNKKFLQSVAAGIATLGLIASCSHIGSNKESNTCGAKNGCAGKAVKKDEAHKCSAKNKEAHKCAAAKEAAAPAATKEVKHHGKKHKKAAAAVETKAEEKKN